MKILLILFLALLAAVLLYFWNIFHFFNHEQEMFLTIETEGTVFLKCKNSSQNSIQLCLSKDDVSELKAFNKSFVKATVNIGGHPKLKIHSATLTHLNGVALHIRNVVFKGAVPIIPFVCRDTL